MIIHGSRFEIQTAVPLRNIVSAEHQIRSLERVKHYLHLLLEHPDRSLGPIMLAPYNGAPGFYRILDGHHRFLATHIAGRATMLAVVIYEPHDDRYSMAQHGEWQTSYHETEDTA